MAVLRLSTVAGKINNPYTMYNPIDQALAYNYTCSTILVTSAQEYMANHYASGDVHKRDSKSQRDDCYIYSFGPRPIPYFPP